MTDHRVNANVKIYSNLAEIIQPLGKLPLEFSSEDWSEIRSDSIITLISSNVNITQQTITEKKNHLIIFKFMFVHHHHHKQKENFSKQQ
jgi:hypothetical protein